MISLLLFLVFTTSALSQCPTSSDNDSTCKNVTTVDWDLEDISAGQPDYYTFFPNTSRYNQLDNVCVTTFPLTDGAWTVYISFVYLNGSSHVDVYNGRTIGVGTYVLANTRQTSTRYAIGYIGCGTYAYYGCGNYGAIGQFPLVSGSGNLPGKLNCSCQQAVYSIMEANELSSDDGVYFLPYSLPCQCVTQQLCQPKGNPLYCQEGGACQLYESSSAS